MNPTLSAHKDAVTLVLSALGVLTALMFGHFKTWRHRICFEYDGTRAAAIAALRDSFQEQASVHFGGLKEHVEATGESVQQFYANPEQRKYVKLLGIKLERINQIINLHSRLLFASQVVEISLWTLILLLLVALALMWGTIAHVLFVSLLSVFAAAALAMVLSICLTLYFEARFITATHKALRPEFE